MLKPNKFRVVTLKSKNYLYIQYYSRILKRWRFIYNSRTGDYLAFVTEAYAIDYCKKLLNEDSPISAIVWEGSNVKT